MRRITLVVLALLVTLGTARSETTAVADTLVVDLPELTVVGEAAIAVSAGRTRLDTRELEVLDPVSVADLTVALPSTRAAVNSRGDAHPMVRGAPERHVQTFLDGIPLNIPWDERVDLETIPAIAVGTMEGSRGPASLLDGPGALAGSLRLLPPALVGNATVTDLQAAFGSAGHRHLELAQRRRAGSWQLQGAGSWHSRDGWPLPKGGPRRQNSDLDQVAILLRAARPVAGTGRLSLLGSAWSGAKGVPPETHLGSDARYWRYPIRERALFGAVVVLPLDRAGRWDLGATLSADFHRQEIDPRGPNAWDTPRQPGQDYEENLDRTGYSRLRLTRWLGDDGAIALQTSARYTHHRERLVVGGPEYDYAQWLTSTVLTGDVRFGSGWDLRAGAGWDHAATPQSGDKPAGDARHVGATNLRLSRELGPDRGIYVAAGRRSRFPSLREAYSGALGRFVPNPDLGPERQDQIEVGGTYTGRIWNMQAAAFYGRLTDGIERIAVSSTQYQRVNRDEIRVPGVEMIAAWRPGPDLDVTLQHTILDARTTTDDGDRAAEDRPAYLTRAGVGWQRWTGPEARIEARVTGSRWSADGTAPQGLRRLPAGATWHLRLGWRWPTTRGDLELHLRVDNLFDQWIDDQTGLPQPGRIFSGGVGWTR